MADEFCVTQESWDGLMATLHQIDKRLERIEAYAGQHQQNLTGVRNAVLDAIMPVVPAEPAEASADAAPEA